MHVVDHSGLGSLGSFVSFLGSLGVLLGVVVEHLDLEPGRGQRLVVTVVLSVCGHSHVDAAVATRRDLVLEPQDMHHKIQDKIQK